MKLLKGKRTLKCRSSFSREKGSARSVRDYKPKMLNSRKDGVPCKAYPQVRGGTGEGKKVPPGPKRKDKKIGCCGGPVPSR